MAQGGGAAPPPEAVRKGISKTLLAVIVVVVAVIAFVAGIGVGNVIYAPKAASAYLVVGTNIPFPPFEDYNYTSGQYVGFDINFSRMIAYASHRTLVIQNFEDFNALLTTTGKGGVDMAASAITESGATGANRSKFMAFSDPYYDANQGVLVTSGSTFKCAVSTNCTASDFSSVAHVGVQSGTTSESWADANLPASKIVTYTGVDTELLALKQGSIDAVIIDNGPAGAIAAGSGGSIKVAGTIITGEEYGFGVAFGDPEGLLPIINSVISNAKSNGTYQQMLTYWFG